MDADAAPSLETLVGLGVVGHHRHLLAGHHVEDGARDRHRGGGAAIGLASPEQLELRGAGLVEQDDEAAVDHDVVEDHVHDLLEHRLELLDLDQGLGHLGEDLEHPFTGADLLGHRHRGAVAVEAVVEVELGQRAQVGGRGQAALRRRLARGLDLELERADGEPVAGADHARGDEGVVDLHAVGRVEVEDPEGGPVSLDLGVVAGHREVAQDDVVVARPAHGQTVPHRGPLADAAVFVEELEHQGHCTSTGAAAAAHSFRVGFGRR